MDSIADLKQVISDANITAWFVISTFIFLILGRIRYYALLVYQTMQRNEQQASSQQLLISLVTTCPGRVGGLFPFHSGHRWLTYLLLLYGSNAMGAAPDELTTIFILPMAASRPRSTPVSSEIQGSPHHIRNHNRAISCCIHAFSFLPQASFKASSFTL